MLAELRSELRSHRKSSMKPVSRMLKGEIIRELEHMKHRVEKETGIVEKEVKAIIDAKKEKVAKVAKKVVAKVEDKVEAKVAKKVVAKVEEEKKAGKGSQAMKEKMAHLRSLRKTKSSKK